MDYEIEVITGTASQRNTRFTYRVIAEKRIDAIAEAVRQHINKYESPEVEAIYIRCVIRKERNG